MNLNTVLQSPPARQFPEPIACWQERMRHWAVSLVDRGWSIADSDRAIAYSRALAEAERIREGFYKQTVEQQEAAIDEFLACLIQHPEIAR
jgi:hypothetical protein